MKHFKRLLLVLLAFVTFSCDKGEQANTEPTPSPKPTDKIELAAGTDLNPVISTDGGTLSVTFNASTAWSAQAVNDRADGWCSVSPTSGNAGSGTITITAKANTEPDERSASINIKAGTATQTIKVTQKQKDALTVTSSTFEVPAEGKDINIEVKANVSVTYKIDQQCSGWIKYVSTKALKTSTLTFTVSKNENVEKREGKIIIGEGTLADTIKIFQAGEAPSIVLNKDEYIAKSEGETFAVEVASNVDITYLIEYTNEDGTINTDSDNWLQESRTRTMSTNTYYFTAATNEEYDNRWARIVFTNKENNLSDTIRVTQLQKDAIIIAKNVYEFGVDGGNLDFEIQTNIDVKIEISDNAKSWITQIETRGLESMNLFFSVARSEEDSLRKGEIKLSGREVVQTISVMQYGVKDMPDTLWYDSANGSFELVAATNSNAFAFLEKDTLFSYRCVFESKNSNKMVAYSDSVGNVGRFVVGDKVYDLFYHSNNERVDIMYAKDGEVEWIRDLDNPGYTLHQTSNLFGKNSSCQQQSYTAKNSNTPLAILQKMSSTIYELIENTPFEIGNETYAHIYSYLKKYTNYSEEDAQAVALLYAGYDGKNYSTHIRDIYEEIINVVAEHRMQVRQALYANALPVVHPYAGILENNEVQLICHVNDVDSLHTNFLVGIAVWEKGESLSDNSLRGMKLEMYNSSKIFYPFFFKGLRSGKSYEYSAFLAPAYMAKDSSIFNTLIDYFRYGSKQKFDKLEVKSHIKEVGYNDATITLSVDNPERTRVEAGLFYSLDPTFPKEQTTQIECEASSDKQIAQEVKIQNLLTDTTYYYKPYIIYNGKLINKEINSLGNVFTEEDMMFEGEVSSFTTKKGYDNEEIRRILTRIYNECNGKNWEHQKNWCTDAPVSEWEGVYFQPILKSWDLKIIQNELKGTIRIEDCQESIFLIAHYDNNLIHPNQINLIAKNCKELEVIVSLFTNVSIENSSFIFGFSSEKTDPQNTKSIRISNCVNKYLWGVCKFVNLQSLILENSTFISESGIELLNSHIDTFSIINCNFVGVEFTLGMPIDIGNSHIKQFLIKNVYSDYRFDIRLDSCVCDIIHSEIYNKTHTISIGIDNSTINTISSICESNQNHFQLGAWNSSIINCIGNGFESIYILENANINYIDTPEARMEFSSLRKIYGIKSVKVKTLDTEDYSLYLSNLQNGIEELEIYDGYAEYLDLRNAPPSLKFVKIHFNNKLHHCKVYMDNSINRFNLRLSGKSFYQQIPDSYDLLSFSYERRYDYFDIYDKDGNVIGKGYNDNNYGWWYSGEPERGYH